MAIFSLIEENLLVAPDLRKGLFYVAFSSQALDQAYQRSLKVPKSPEPKNGACMPLIEKITFKTNITKENRLKVPKNAIDQYKFETNQLLKITISISNVWEAPRLFSQK